MLQTALRAPGSRATNFREYVPKGTKEAHVDRHRQVDACLNALHDVTQGNGETITLLRHSRHVVGLAHVEGAGLHQAGTGLKGLQRFAAAGIGPHCLLLLHDGPSLGFKHFQAAFDCSCMD